LVRTIIVTAKCFGQAGGKFKLHLGKSKMRTRRDFLSRAAMAAGSIGAATIHAEAALLAQSSPQNFACARVIAATITSKYSLESRRDPDFAGLHS
jgi:hypothetical protein